MRKRKVIFIVLSILIILLIGVGIFLFKSGFITIKEAPKPPTIIIQKDESGRTFTTDLWEWKPDIRSDKITYIPDTSSYPSKSEVLQISEFSYVTIDVPDKDIINENLKVIYSKDGSFIIQIMQNCSKDTLEDMLGLSECNWEDDVMFTKTTVNGAQVIATCVDNVAIVTKIYFGDDTYSILLNSYRNGLIHQVIETSNKTEKSNINSLPTDDMYLPTASYDFNDLAPYEFHYADGNLFIQRDLNKLSKTKKQYEVRMNVLTNSTLSSYCQIGKVYYMECGEYTTAILNVSSNDNIVMTGKGKEARANILYLIELYD